MDSATTADGAAFACDLIRLLHREASGDELARRLAAIEAWPDDRADKAALVEAARMTMAVRERLDLREQRERGLLAVIESAQDLSSRLDLNGLLTAIVSRARHLVGSDVAWLSIHDAERGAFRVLVADGALAPTTSAMVARPEFGVAGLVMSTRLPFTTPDYLHDKRFAHDPALDDAFRDEGIAALVGVPLVREGLVIGLLFVADRYHRTHSAQSIAILRTLAVHGAVALRNAEDFERASAALEHADRARAELERHVRGIQAATDAHERLTSLLASGASLSTLCATVGELLGGAVVVLDEAGRIVGRGAAPDYADVDARGLAPHERHGPSLARALRASRTIGRSVVAFETDGETCRAMPVIGGADVLGTALLFHRAPLEEIAVRTFERASSVVGIVLLSQERIEATRRRGVATLLRSAVSLRQDEPALLVDEGARHGVDLAQPLSLLLVETDSVGAGYVANRVRRLPAFEQVLVDEIDGLLVFLSGAIRAPDVADAVATTARAEFGAVFRGVQSRPVSGLAEVPALYATLRRALPVLGRLGIAGHVVAQNELALYSALFETHDASSLDEYIGATIGALLAHDRRRAGHLADTLLAYFDATGSAKATAESLGIHVNTVRQRLATIESLIGSWSSAARALEIHVALRLWRLRPRDR